MRPSSLSSAMLQTTLYSPTYPVLAKIEPPSINEVHKIIYSMPAKMLPLDHTPTAIIKICADTFVPPDMIALVIALSFN